VTVPASEGKAGTACADGHLQPVELYYDTSYGAAEWCCLACGAEWLVAD
jgi:hypothetical protein